MSNAAEQVVRKVANWRSTRRGSLLVEVGVAMVILTVALVAIAQTLGMVALQRRESERRLLAMQAAANLMEQIAAQPFGQITTERVAALKLPDELQQALPDARLDIDVTPTADEPAGKRIRIDLAWTNRAGQQDAPVRLVAWKFQPREPQP
jgi:type II secretory pathway pseudopilin PulG